MNIKNADAEYIPGLRRLWKEAFSDTDEFLDVFFSTAFASERSFIIEEKDKVTSALYVFDCLYKEEKIAYIYAVATAKDHRGKGLCRKLMEHTHKALRASGYKGAILVPGEPTLFDFYSKIGYKTCCYLNEVTDSSGSCGEPVQEISAEDFALLRRQMLPANVVIQEGENLEFLRAYAGFYKGDDFLFTASNENGTLVCHEFLGNTAKIPNVLRTMGCKEGTFRTIGKERPFAMYLPFEGEDFPAHFGFAFD